MTVGIHLGNCLDVLKNLKENSVDSIVTDPPYGIGFMGKKWDTFKQNKRTKNQIVNMGSGMAFPKLAEMKEFQDWCELWAKECLRVLKPGGYLLSFSGTRTYHRMACAIEDAGFEVRDMIEWVYGSGFPKSLNIGKAVDKLQGNEREEYNPGGRYKYSFQEGNSQFVSETATKSGKRISILPTKGTSEWEGWGTALKPAHEPICMARKPISEKTVAENVLKWGTGGINIDESRVESNEHLARPFNEANNNTFGKYEKFGNPIEPSGRFPANLIHDNSEEVRECFPECKSAPCKNHIGSGKGKTGNNPFMEARGGVVVSRYVGEGNASRFFKSIAYVPKASKSERTAKGTITNGHPTIKPIALMEYLIKMITPPKGVVLDPFMGSGSTGVAAVENGYNFIGIDMTPEYIEIAKARINAVKPKLL